MKESIHTIPLMDAFKAEDECPFCYLEREAEQHAISFALGSGASYMEDDVRAETDAMGFCRHHYKMMYDYGNRLGSGLILSTHLKKLNQELAAQMDLFAPGKSSVFKRMQNDILTNRAVRLRSASGLMRRRIRATSAITSRQTITAILIRSLISTKKTRSLQDCSAREKASVCRILRIW